MTTTAIITAMALGCFLCVALIVYRVHATERDESYPDFERDNAPLDYWSDRK